MGFRSINERLDKIEEVESASSTNTKWTPPPLLVKPAQTLQQLQELIENSVSGLLLLFSVAVYI